MEVGDEVLSVAAAHRLGLVRTEQWPMVAALLLAAGFDGEALVDLAGRPRAVSGWEVDRLVPRMLEELHAPTVDVEAAGDVAARLLASSPGAVDHPVIRSLALLAPGLDYPGGRIGEAYQLAEWLDCDCHEGSQERLDARAFEAEVRALPPLAIPLSLARALTGG